MTISLRESIEGSILGTAVGDAVGLPGEGLTRRRQQRIFGELSGHRLLGSRGMISDDTEQTCLVAAALAASKGDVSRFRRELASSLRWWLAAAPPAVGFATLRACLRLCLGFSPERSGVFSAGNGPAMRSALIGVRHGDDPKRMRELVRASTRITHTDPKAEAAAYAVAAAADLSRRGRAELPAGTGLDLEPVARSVARGESTAVFAASIGLASGVSGYCLHTVPVALHAWLSHPRDLRQAVLAAVHCGGDTDTTAAITGAIAGAGVGPAGVPGDWLSGLWEWPRTVTWMRRLARALADGTAPPPSPPFPAIVLRNLFFAAIILGHGVRRAAFVRD